MKNPLLDRLSKRGVLDHGKLAEKHLSKRLKASLTPASGAMSGAKGDIVLPGIRLEAKSTTGSSLSLQLSWLRKISHEASELGEIPALAIQFVSLDGKVRETGSWIMVREIDFESIKEAFKESTTPA